jgi:hypothetical protein
MFHLSLGHIVWLIGLIWRYKPSHTYFCYFALNILQCLYIYFNHNLKRHLESTKLAKIMEIKGNKILWNIKTKLISMISHVKLVLSKYHTLLMKMPLDAPTIASTKSNLCFAYWCKNIVGVECHYATVGGSSFIDQIFPTTWCDFITSMKICERDVY